MPVSTAICHFLLSVNKLITTIPSDTEFHSWTETVIALVCHPLCISSCFVDIFDLKLFEMERADIAQLCGINHPKAVH